MTFYISVSDAEPIKRWIDGKYIPGYFFLFSDRQFELLLDILITGDGNWQKKGHNGVYTTKDKGLADILQALAVSHGWRAYINKHKNCYDVSLCKRKTVTIFNKNSRMSSPSYETISASHVAWCVSVDNGTIFTRRKGRVSVLGNTHQLMVVPPTGELYLYHKDGKVEQDYLGQGWNERHIDPNRRWYVNTGAFLLRSTDQVGHDNLPFSGYPERRGYAPMVRGFAVVKAEGGRLKEVEAIRL